MIPSQVSRGQSDPMDVDAVNSLSSGKEKGHRVHEMVVSSVVEHNFNETAMHPNATASNHLCSTSEGKGKSKES